MVNGKLLKTKRVIKFELFVFCLKSLFIRWTYCLRSIDDLYVWLYASSAEITRVVLLGEERLCWHFLQRFAFRIHGNKSVIEFAFFCLVSVDYWDEIIGFCCNLMCDHGFLACVLTIDTFSSFLSFFLLFY